MAVQKSVNEAEASSTAFAQKPRVLKKLKHPRRWLALLIAAVLVCGVAVKVLSAKKPGGASEISYTEEQVMVRTITNSLSSSGTLEPANSYTVSTLVSGEILNDTFEEGDLVEKDQLLYTLDSSDANSSQTQASNSYSQAQKSYEQAVKAKYPTSDISGIVSEVYVRNGDTVNAGTELCRIVESNDIIMDFVFSYVDSDNFYVGQIATIFINGFDGSINGTVQQVSGSSVASGNAAGSGMELTTVRVKAVNPGLVTEDYTGSAVIGSYSSYGNTPVKISDASTITAQTSGKIAGLSLLAGDSVAKGDRICTITGDSVDNSIENARISVSNAANSLKNAQSRLEDYQVKAPISGTVVTKIAKAGDNVDGGILCTIYDLSYLEMTMSIDELDISDVAAGQTVEVTADAVEGKTYVGVVTKVSVAGTTSGGITTYPVTVRIGETDGLLPGMNVDAKIVIEERADVTAIPNSAVNRGDTVLVTSDSPSAANALDQEAPEGYAYVRVETGISDGSYTEIVSGLQKDDTVAYIRAASSGNNNMMGGMAMGAMPGGGNMSGGMPGGGRPSGGPGGGF